MNKFLFQFGLLAFFVSLAVFSLQAIPLFDAIMRAFIVFIVLEVAFTFGIVIVTVSGKKPPEISENPETEPIAQQQLNSSNTTGQ